MAEGIIVGIRLTAHERQRPTVQKQMMLRPDKEEFALGQTNKRHSHQRWSAQVESPLQVFRQVFPESCRLVTNSEIAPVGKLYRYSRSAIYDLQRFAQPFPVERRTQRRVRLYHSLPGMIERGNAQFGVESETELTDVDSRTRRIKRMKEYSLLQRCERVDVLNLPAWLEQSIQFPLS